MNKTDILKLPDIGLFIDSFILFISLFLYQRKMFDSDDGVLVW